MKAIFTVDVEGHVGNDPIRHLIYGEASNGKKYGMDMIMDLLDRNGGRGLFFVDIAAAWDYGEEGVNSVLRHIKDRGHDVGVHIHPDHMADKSRCFLHEYSYDEQYDIISKCTDFYEDVLKERPKAFRAGKYGANRDTLDIIAGLGYAADFSQFYGRKWCRIDPPCSKIKRVQLENGLIEIPVTVFKSFDNAFYERFDKIDATQPYPEFKWVMSEMTDRKLCDTVVLFAHSFSFLNWRSHPDRPSFSPAKYNRLQKQIEYVISENKVKFCSLEDLLDVTELESFDKSEEDIATVRGWLAGISLLYRTGMVLRSKLDICIRNLRGEYQ